MGDDAILSPAQIEAAVAAGRLGRLAERLAGQGDLASLDRLLAIAGNDSTALEELAAAARAIDRTLKRYIDGLDGKAMPAGAAHEIRALRLLTASTIAHRLRRDPLTAAERVVLGLAAAIFLTAGETLEAARLFERAGDDTRAADAYAALGDIEKMEACHDRLDALRADRSAVHRLRDRIEALNESGQRVAALALMRAFPSRRIDEAGLAETLSDLDRRLCRGRVLLLTAPGTATPLRLVCAPAVLGRDPACEIPLRDPGVSRRHAAIVTDAGLLALEDAGSRAGTRIGAATLGGRAPLSGGLEIALGAHCRIGVTRRTPEVIELRGLTGLDRSLHVLLSSGWLDLALVHPDAEGLRLALEGGTARLERHGARRVTVSGRLIGHTCDLLHGDQLEIERRDARHDQAATLPAPASPALPPLRLEIG